MNKPMSTKSKIQLWIYKQQKDYFSGCGYDGEYVLVGYATIDKFVGFIGGKHSGDII